MSDFRAMPAAVFVPDNTMKSIAQKIARLPEDQRSSATVILIRLGKYRANTDEVTLYNHESTLPRQYPKGDLIGVKVLYVSHISEDQRLLMGAPADNKSFLEYLRESWHESLELDSAITLLTVTNLRGALIDYYVNSFSFLGSSPSFKE